MKLYTNRKLVVMKINYNKKSLWLWSLITYNKIFRKNFAAITNPFTNTIHSLVKIKEHDRVYEHEKIHLMQIQKTGKIKFLILYLFYSAKYGYEKNPFELEAYYNDNTCQCIENDKTIYKN